MPTVAEIGQLAIAKHPEYEGHDAYDLGTRLIAKYPDYAAHVTPEAAHPAVNMQPESINDVVQSVAARSSDPNEHLRTVGNMGRGAVRNLSSMVDQAITPSKWAINHPDPTNVFGADEGKRLYQSYKKGGLTQSLEDAGGDALTAGLLHSASESVGSAAEPAARVLNATGRATKSLGAKVSGFTVGAPAPADNLGADVGAGLSETRTVGTSPRSLANKVKAKIGPAAQARDQILSQSTAPATDVAPHIAQPFDDIVADKTDPVTGAAKPHGIRRLTEARRSIQEIQDPDTGQPTGVPKRSALSPAEMGKLQRNVYDLADYSTTENDLANQGIKGAGAALKTKINEVAPEATPMTDQLHNMLGAQDLLKSKTGAPPSATDLAPGKVAGKLLDTARYGVGTAAGAALDATGTGLMKLGGAVRRAVSSPVAPTAPSGPTNSAAPGLPAPGQGTANQPVNFPSRVIPPSNPAAGGHISGTPVAPVVTPPPPVNPRGLLQQVAGPAGASPQPSTASSPVPPTLYDAAARTRVAPTEFAPQPTPQASGRRLIATPEGIRPEPLPLPSPRPVPALESRTGTRAPSARPSLISQLQAEAGHAAITREADLAGAARKVRQQPVATEAPPAPAPAPKKLAAKVATPVPKPKPASGGLPAPGDIDGWEALVDEGKARYNAGSHQYEYTGPIVRKGK